MESCPQRVLGAVDGMHRFVSARRGWHRRPQTFDVAIETKDFGAYRGRDQGPGWAQLSYGLYLPIGARKQLAAELSAWRLVLPPEAAFTHLTAAELRGWWLPAAIEHPVFAAAQEGDPCPRRSGLMMNRRPDQPPRQFVCGAQVTSGAETLLAAARDLGVIDLVLMGDSALRLGHTSLDELTELSCRRRRGVSMLRRIVPLLDARSESPWESVMRVLHQAAGVSVSPQKEIFDEDGQFLARADLWLVGTKRVHEYDGALHRERDVHHRDLVRDRRLVVNHWQRVGYTSQDLLQDGASVIASADQALGRSWDPRRLTRWNKLVAESLYGPVGRARAHRRWGAPTPRTWPTVDR